MKQRDEYQTIDDIILDCVNKTRGQTSLEVWERYQTACKRLDILPLPGQAKTAVTRLLQAGKITLNPHNKTVTRN